jgi:hypothetical protein
VATIKDNFSSFRTTTAAIQLKTSFPNRMTEVRLVFGKAKICRLVSRLQDKNPLAGLFIGLANPNPRFVNDRGQ